MALWVRLGGLEKTSVWNWDDSDDDECVCIDEIMNFMMHVAWLRIAWRGWCIGGR
jgi:hypothetical protein